MNEADIITHIINTYTQVFSGYFSQFLNWGKWLFNGFFIIAIVWLCLWQAFSKAPLTTNMAGFLKEFFTIAFFYTIMVNAATWLPSIVDSAQVMHQQLSHHLVDPASIIQQGLTIANKILAPVKNSGIINLSFGALLIIIAYLVTLTAFIAVALNLAVTYLITTFFISFAALLLAFGAVSVSRSIARRTLDVIIGHSFKLLSLYLVIDAGSVVFTQISTLIPKDKIDSFDVDVWPVAAAILFWFAAKKIPQLVLKIFTDAFQNASDYPTSTAESSFFTQRQSSQLSSTQLVNPIPANFELRPLSMLSTPKRS